MLMRAKQTGTNRLEKNTVLYANLPEPRAGTLQGYIHQRFKLS